MIAKEFEDFLLARLDNYLIPSDQVAIFIDSHNADHVVLLLTSNGYSRVPVLTKDKHFCMINRCSALPVTHPKTDLIVRNLISCE